MCPRTYNRDCQDVQCVVGIPTENYQDVQFVLGIPTGIIRTSNLCKDYRQALSGRPVRPRTADSDYQDVLCVVGIHTENYQDVQCVLGLSTGIIRMSSVS